MKSRNVEIDKALSPLAAIAPRTENLGPKEEHDFYMKTKKVLAEFEKTNRQYIVFYHRMQQWWHTCENSMLIYYHYVAKRLGIPKLIVRKDNDYGRNKWKSGQIVTSNIESVKNKFEIGGVKIVLDTPEVVAFRLEKPVSEENMKVLAESEQNKIARFNSLVLPKNVYPKILQKTAMIHREIVNKAVNLPESRRKYYGDKGVEISSELSYLTIRMSNDRISKQEYFQRAIELAGELNDWLAFVNKFEMFDSTIGLAVAEKVANLEDVLKAEQRQLNRKKIGGAEAGMNRVENDYEPVS